jgi:hypothetical protein
MDLRVLSVGHADLLQVDHHLKQLRFRKATRTMALACASIEAALKASPQLEAIFVKEPQRFGLVLGSAFGELEATTDFLKTLADSGVARPVLFQNSLHNSTSGFASIYFHLTGPVVTVSHGWFALEQALEVANLLLAQKQNQQRCDFVIVTYAEVIMPDLVEQDSTAMGQVSKSTSFIVTRSETASSEKLPSLAHIDDVKCIRAPRASAGVPEISFFSESTSAIALANELLSTATGLRALKVAKSETDYSLFSWRRN